MAASPREELEEYWNEVKTFEHTDAQSDDDELSKTPDEGEAEAAWLDAAGYGFVVNSFQDGKELSDGELDTLTHSLTRAQAEAVRKRINVLSTTLRRKNKGGKVHVRDIFPSQDGPMRAGDAATLPRTGHSWHPPHSPTGKQTNRSGEQRSSAFLHKGGYSMSGGTGEVTQDTDAGVATLGVHPRPKTEGSSPDQFSSLPSVSDIEISLDFHLEESDKSPPPSNIPDPHRVDLPGFEPKPDPLGVTLVGDLAAVDMERVKSLAHIELTALFDIYNISYNKPKRKKKVKEQGIFGVPLELLVDQDQKRSSSTSNIPVVFQAMITFLEKEGLDTEGILRVSGAESRTKQLRQELEEKFYQGLFSWGEFGPHDVAVVMKQFLRELPVPLLSYDYLDADAFPEVSRIPKTLEQLKALNLLILLLPDEHRDTLKVLLRFLRNVISHSNHNKMGLNNVAMIMAPNLFLSPARGNKEKADLEQELKKAAGTSNIVKMLIHYQDVLWTIPTAFIAQLRHQYTTESHRKSNQRILSRLPWKKDKDRSEIYKKPPPSPDQPEPQDGVIRVHAPHLTKSSALIQLDQFTTAADVVDKFKCEQNMRREDSTIGKMEETNGHTYRNPNNAQYAHDSDYLYEVGGNIAERCLDPRTKMMDLYHVNPLAEWVIKKNEGRQHLLFPGGHHSH